MIITIDPYQLSFAFGCVFGVAFMFALACLVVWRQRRKAGAK